MLRKKQTDNNVKEYYKLTFDESRKKQTGIGNIVYTVVFLAFWIIAGLMNTDSSRVFWVLFPYYFICLPIIYFGYGAVNYLTLPIRMERMAYDASIRRMHRSGLGIIIMTAITILLDIIYMIINHQNVNIGKEILFIVCLAGVIVVGILYARFYDKYYANVTVDT